MGVCSESVWEWVERNGEEWEKERKRELTGISLL